ncbi:MAG: multicopper oxidase domain-containing protein [Alphaproteobacteria bacterium]|nr:multicopper oxidase domain-containing protein [Alphaproteobacteria bacterium]
MIRIFVLIGIVGGLAVAYLTTFGVGKISQLPPSESLLTNFRAEGFVPKEINLGFDESAEEAKTFSVPAMDAVMLAAARKNMGSMKGMDMGGADSSTMENADGTTMDMATADSTMKNADGTTMDMSGSTAPAMNTADANTQMDMGKGGLLVTDGGAFDREISLEMSEWKFSKMRIDVKVGEKIKFTVKNSGQIPHEFMFMDMPLMQAVTYRATRADWNLVEHEALYERSLVLPGGDFTFVLNVEKAGTWMFMCMLPYHMEMGMMGQMSTPGNATDM